MARMGRERDDVVADEASRGESEPKTFDRTMSNRIGEVNLESEHQLQRGLKSRHIQFLALGGA